MDMQIIVLLLLTCTSPFLAAMLVLSLLFSTQCLHLPFHGSHFPSLLSCLLLSCAFPSTVPASRWEERLQVGFHHCVRVGELLLLTRFVQNFLRDHIPQCKTQIELLSTELPKSPCQNPDLILCVKHCYSLYRASACTIKSVTSAETQAWHKRHFQGFSSLSTQSICQL